MRKPTPEKVQAFIEDLVAVEAKHGLCLGDYPWASIVRLDPVIDHMFVHGADLSVAFHDGDELGHRKIVAKATYPKTAHARLQAAARVAEIRQEVAR